MTNSEFRTTFPERKTWADMKPALEVLAKINGGSYLQSAIDNIDHNVSDMRKAVGNLNMDLVWLNHGAGTFVTIDTKKLIALIQARDRL